MSWVPVGEGDTRLEGEVLEGREEGVVPEGVGTPGRQGSLGKERK